MRLWVRPEANMAQAVSPIFKDHCISTRRRIITFWKRSINCFIPLEPFAHRNNDLIYCQIIKWRRFSSWPTISPRKAFPWCVYSLVFTKQNNNSLRGANTKLILIKKRNLSQGNTLMTWTFLDVTVSLIVHELHGSGILTWFPFQYIMPVNKS